MVRTVTCEVCYALVPAQASNCPDCGSALDRTVAASPLDREEASARTIAPNSASHMRILWLTAGVGLLLVTIILILSLRH
jgi:hypothetical protein